MIPSEFPRQPFLCFSSERTTPPQSLNGVEERDNVDEAYDKIFYSKKDWKNYLFIPPPEIAVLGNRQFWLGCLMAERGWTDKSTGLFLDQAIATAPIKLSLFPLIGKLQSTKITISPKNKDDPFSVFPIIFLKQIIHAAHQVVCDIRVVGGILPLREMAKKFINDTPIKDPDILELFLASVEQISQNPNDIDVLIPVSTADREAFENLILEILGEQGPKKYPAEEVKDFCLLNWQELGDSGRLVSIGDANGATFDLIIWYDQYSLPQLYTMQDGSVSVYEYLAVDYRKNESELQVFGKKPGQYVLDVAQKLTRFNQSKNNKGRWDNGLQKKLVVQKVRGGGELQNGLSEFAYEVSRKINSRGSKSVQQMAGSGQHRHLSQSYSTQLANCLNWLVVVGENGKQEEFEFIKKCWESILHLCPKATHNVPLWLEQIRECLYKSIPQTLLGLRLVAMVGHFNNRWLLCHEEGVTQAKELIKNRPWRVDFSDYDGEAGLQLGLSKEELAFFPQHYSPIEDLKLFGKWLEAQDNTENLNALQLMMGEMLKWEPWKFSSPNIPKIKEFLKEYEAFGLTPNDLLVLIKQYSTSKQPFACYCAIQMGGLMMYSKEKKQMFFDIANALVPASFIPKTKEGKIALFDQGMSLMKPLINTHMRRKYYRAAEGFREWIKENSEASFEKAMSQWEAFLHPPPAKPLPIVKPKPKPKPNPKIRELRGYLAHEEREKALRLLEGCKKKYRSIFDLSQLTRAIENIVKGLLEKCDKSYLKNINDFLLDYRELLQNSPQIEQELWLLLLDHFLQKEEWEFAGEILIEQVPQLKEADKEKVARSASKLCERFSHQLKVRKSEIMALTQLWKIYRCYRNDIGGSQATAYCFQAVQRACHLKVHQELSGLSEAISSEFEKIRDYPETVRESFFESALEIIQPLYQSDEKALRPSSDAVEALLKLFLNDFRRSRSFQNEKRVQLLGDVCFVTSHVDLLGSSTSFLQSCTDLYLKQKNLKRAQILFKMFEKKIDNEEKINWYWKFVDESSNQKMPKLMEMYLNKLDTLVPKDGRLKKSWKTQITLDIHAGNLEEAMLSLWRHHEIRNDDPDYFKEKMRDICRCILFDQTKNACDLRSNASGVGVFWNLLKESDYLSSRQYQNEADRKFWLSLFQMLLNTENYDHLWTAIRICPFPENVGEKLEPVVEVFKKLVDRTHSRFLDKQGSLDEEEMFLLNEESNKTLTYFFDHPEFFDNYLVIALTKDISYIEDVFTFLFDWASRGINSGEQRDRYRFSTVKLFLLSERSKDPKIQKKIDDLHYEAYHEIMMIYGKNYLKNFVVIGLAWMSYSYISAFFRSYENDE